MGKVNWRKIKTEYVTGKEGYRALAARRGVPFSTISKIASKEGWAEARKKYRNELETKTVEAMCARTCAREIKELEALERAAAKTVGILLEVLGDEEQFRRHLVTKSVAGVGSGVEQKTFEKYDMRALKDFTVALQNMTAAVRDLQGLPTAQEQSAMDIAMERLKLDQARAAVNEREDGETGVVELAAALAEQEESDEDA